MCNTLVRLDQVEACIGILRILIMEALTVGSIEFPIQSNIMVAYVNQSGLHLSWRKSEVTSYNQLDFVICTGNPIQCLL